MNTNKQPRKESEFTANVALSSAPKLVALSTNGWTVGKNFFRPVARKQHPKK
jgi:hypothetical protein